MTDQSTQEIINAQDIVYIKQAVTRIEAQVMTTNGRVSSLEKWKYGLMVGLATLAATKWPVIELLLRHVN